MYTAITAATAAELELRSRRRYLGCRSVHSFWTHIFTQECAVRPLFWCTPHTLLVRLHLLVPGTKSTNPYDRRFNPVNSDKDGVPAVPRESVVAAFLRRELKIPAGARTVTFVKTTALLQRILLVESVETPERQVARRLSYQTSRFRVLTRLAKSTKRNRLSISPRRH